MNHTSLAAVLSMLPIDDVPGSNTINHIMVTSEKGSASPEANVLLSPHLDVEGNKGVGMQWEQQGFDQQWLMFSVHPTCMWKEIRVGMQWEQQDRALTTSIIFPTTCFKYWREYIHNHCEDYCEHSKLIVLSRLHYMVM